MMNFTTIQLETQEGVAYLRLNRPEKLNSFTAKMHTELRYALDCVQQQRELRTLVLTGVGRSFSAGQDLADIPMHEDKPVDMENLIEENYKPLILRLQNLRVPTIAAVNGIAAGAGASVALACDLVIATQSAYFLQAFSKIGLIPDTGGTWFLPQRVGMARAMGLALLAEKLPADTAAKWGLIWQCVEDDKFESTVENLAKQLAKAPTKALVRTRQAMRASFSHTLEQQLSMEAGFIRDLGVSADFIEGVKAFNEKRPAKFTGE